jgi:hypothetical protein
MPTTMWMKVVLALLALVPAILLGSMFGLQVVAPNFDFTPLARVFIWAVPVTLLVAAYFVWIAARSDLPTAQKVGWAVALLLWFPITGIVFWFTVIRRLRPPHEPAAI